MTSTVLEQAPGTVTQPVVRPRLAGEAAVLVLLLFVYDYLRGLTGARRPPALHHARSILHAERYLTVNFEATFNHWLAAQRGTLTWLSVGYYQFMHIGAALTVLAWCYLRRPDLYRAARNALVVTNAVGLLTFAFYPVAPPRLMPGRTIRDLVAGAGFGTSHGPIPMVEYGAMPSLHLAWAAWATVVGFGLTRSRRLRTLLILHPVITGIVVVGTGNHYVLDVIAGSVLGVTATVATGAWANVGLGRKTHRSTNRSSRAVIESTSDAARSAPEQYTLVAFHAHPDDETLLTGGTLARAAAEGHRTIIVVATLGEAGLTGSEHDSGTLGLTRLAELRAAAAALGCVRVESLGYNDSGRDGLTPGIAPFVEAETEHAAERLAAILRHEHADALTIYDPAGGYGHPDHVQVHRIGRRAAELAGTPIVLEATVDRRALLRLTRALRVIPGLPPEFRPAGLERSFSSPEHLTHRVDVRRHLAAKRAAMSAHCSQQSGGSTPRSVSVFLRLPRPLFRRIFGHEWFVEIGRTPDRDMLDDVFATLHGGSR
jgi:LmbE family N-acetylglucosaminyl deacetylase